MMSADALAQALAEVAYQVYRGRKPPANVLKASKSRNVANGANERSGTPAEEACKS
jgi:hypothetical protein